jgi:hypothetical protein
MTLKPKKISSASCENKSTKQKIECTKTSTEHPTVNLVISNAPLLSSEALHNLLTRVVLPEPAFSGVSQTFGQPYSFLPLSPITNIRTLGAPVP